VLAAYAIDAALGSMAQEIHIVTGHENDRLASTLGNRPVNFVHNENYRMGIGSSIHCVINTLPPDIDGVILCLADMPWVRSDHLNALISQFTGNTVCALYFERQRGHPILFPKSWFSRLMTLQGDCGAQSLLRETTETVTMIPALDDAVLRDIDHLEDFPRN
ncbi:uncharacterized protein METZ01_LOCUS47772, partial [marine metagenome]